MQIVQMGMFLVQAQMSSPDSPAGALKAAWDQPENQQLVELLKDGLSQEVFIYGNEEWGALFAIANELSRAQREAQVQAIRDERSPEELMAEKIVDAVSKQLEDFQVPDTVIGMRISDPNRAQAQIARLEKELEEEMKDQPQYEGRMTHEKIGEADFLTVRVDGSLIPWEMLLAQVADQRATVEKLAERIKELEATLSVGVWNDYLIISAGDSNEHLKALGSGAALNTVAELAPLASYADQPLTSIAYVSESFVKKVNNMERQISDAVAMAEQLVPMAELESGIERELIKDIAELGDMLKAHLPQPGAVMGFTFLTDRGYEGFTYSWGDKPSLDPTQPLTILDHLGGAPLAFVAGRGRYSAACFDGVAHIVDRVFYYAEKIGGPEMSEKDRLAFEKIRDAAKQFDRITREKMIPAMSDSQAALVIDAKSTSKQWHKDMPPSDTPLPMLEIALVYGVSDSELVKEAASEYFATLQKLVDALHEIQPEEVPPFKLPPPMTREEAGGTVFYYLLPEAAGLDKLVAPTAGLTQEALAFSMMPHQVPRLMQSLQPTGMAAEGPLADLDRPLASASYLNWAGLIDAITPWVTWGFGLAMPDGNDPSVAMIKNQVDTGLQVLKCFQGAVSATYQEDDAWVTHIESRFQDLP
jgi:hypothetical protein